LWYNEDIISIMIESRGILIMRPSTFGKTIMQKIRVIDRRNKEKFQVDDAYLNGYARHCGISATGVYITLCRHVDYQTQTCFPSKKLIAEKLGISEKTVYTAIKKLEEWNIIEKDPQERKTDGSFKVTNYILLDKSVWKELPSAIFTDGKKRQSPQVNNDTTRRYSLPNKETHIKETHIKETHTAKAQPLQEVPLLIKAFEKINPACKRFYGNTTQRQACEDLISSYGLDKVLTVIEKVLPRTNKEPYMPTINTPHILNIKWADLESALLKTKNKVEKETEPIYW